MTLWSLLFTDRAMIFPVGVVPLESARVAAPTRHEALFLMQCALGLERPLPPNVLIVNAGKIECAAPGVISSIAR